MKDSGYFTMTDGTDIFIGAWAPESRSYFYTETAAAVAFSSTKSLPLNRISN